MKTRALAWLVVVLELASLGIFVFANRKAEMFTPSSAHSGDVGLMFLWEGRAGLAFWSLAVLWGISVLLTVVRTSDTGNYWRRWLRAHVTGVFALATLLPLVGLAAVFLSVAS
jgi:hypothetical protein